MVVVFAIGILIGNRIEYKLNQKSENKKRQLLYGTNPVTQPPLVFPAKMKIINFVVREEATGEITDDETRAKIESIMGSKKVKFNFRIFGKSSDASIQALHDNIGKPNMGMIDASRVVELVKQGVPIAPIYTTSPNQSECYSEIQIISNGSAQKIEDLEKKNIGVDNSALPLSRITFKNLKEKKITVNKLHIYNNPKNALRDLLTKKIDVIMNRVAVNSNNQVASKLGYMDNGAYVQYPGLKILATSNNKVPCKVIFISTILNPLSIQELEAKMIDVTSNPETKELIERGLLIASIRKVTPESWKPVEDVFKDSFNFPLNTFATEIITEKD
jgi:ABC-type phosphate/phosphonate transport system substrate-binding protein